MKRQSEKYQPGVLTELNITPLLDLAFVLLIIFVITSPFLSDGFAENLAPANQSDNKTDPKSVVTVSIDASQNILADGNPIDGSHLGQFLNQRLKGSPDPESFGVLIEAHRDLAVHDLLDLMTRIKGAGVSKVGVTEHKPKVAPATPDQ